MYIVSNKAKDRISKPLSSENKLTFPKTNISLSPDQGGKCYQEVRNVSFREILRTLFSCKHRFEIRSFALLPTIIKYQFHNS